MMILSHIVQVLWSYYFSFHLVAKLIIYFVLHIYRMILRLLRMLCNMIFELRSKGLLNSILTT